MKYATINDKKYPYKLVIAACIEFEEEQGITIAEVKTIKHMQHLLYVGLKWGAKIKGEELDISLDDLGLMEVDTVAKCLEEVADIPK